MGFALIFTVLISSVIAGLLYHSLYYNKQTATSLNQYRAIYACKSLLNYGIYHPKVSSWEKISGGNYNVFWWGVYEGITATLRKPHIEISKSVLFGFTDASKLVLYMADRNSAISIAGNTEIKGDIMHPRGGLKRVNIEGKTFRNTNFPIGQKIIASKILPLPQEDLISSLQSLLTHYPIVDSTLQIDFLPSAYKRNFNEGTALLRIEKNTIIENIQLDGRIIIYAPNCTITVASNAILNNVIICAKNILIKSEFSGCIQAVASEEIEIEPSVQLKFPSAVIVQQLPKHKSQSSIIIGESSRVEGNVAILPHSINGYGKGIIFIEKHAVVKGHLYSCDNVSLRGIVYGAAWCRGFYLKTPSSVYLDHLLDATLIRDSLPKVYAGALIHTNATKARIKWLD